MATAEFVTIVFCAALLLGNTLGSGLAKRTTRAWVSGAFGGLLSLVMFICLSPKPYPRTYVGLAAEFVVLTFVIGMFAAFSATYFTFEKTKE